MRFVGTALVLLLTACASASTPGLPAPEPMGNLAQVMRGILFTNSNILFDVQSSDPDAPPAEVASGGGCHGELLRHLRGMAEGRERGDRLG